MKKINLLLVIVLIAAFALFALGSTEEGSSSQGSEKVSTTEQSNQALTEDNDNVETETTESSDRLGDYTVVIDSCRFAKDITDEPVVIVKYIFSNVENDSPVSFASAIEEQAYQNGVSLTESFILESDAKYDFSDQTKEIKKGATLEVEVAYELHDPSADVEVEVSENSFFSDKVITKTFSIE